MEVARHRHRVREYKGTVGEPPPAVLPAPARSNINPMNIDNSRIFWHRSSVPIVTSPHKKTDPSASQPMGPLLRLCGYRY